MGPNILVKFEDVSAVYENGVGVFNISFDISKGEFVFIMGPTGSGKSTILRSIYMDVQIKDGSLYFNQNDLSKLKKRNVPFIRRDIGMIFQDYKLLEDRSVYNNVSLPLQISGIKSTHIKERVYEMLKKVGLEDKTNSMPKRLSGGERQRIAIARALVKEPSLILADEPTGNLDPIVSDEILDLLEDLTQSMGSAVLMSTHDFPLIQPRQKRFIEMSEGRQVINDI